MIIRYENKHFEALYDLIHDTIEKTYHIYYPKEAVDYFHQHHLKENLLQALDKEVTLLFLLDDEIIATGSFEDNYIKRMFVNPKFQGRGYGSRILNELEDLIKKEGINEVKLSSSLGAYDFYLMHGYEQEDICSIDVSNAKLVYIDMVKTIPTKDYKINYNNKKFISCSNSNTGEVDERTIFEYKQRNNIVWGTYKGGEIIKGFLIGKSDEIGNLSFTYQHINRGLDIRTGICTSCPIYIDGKLHLKEKWRWTNGSLGEGESEIKEL